MPRPSRRRYRPEFQSTPSVGRATLCDKRGQGSPRYFNPHPPWGGRPRSANCFNMFFEISIHTLRGEGDDGGILVRAGFVISIHTLRGEGDELTLPLRCGEVTFQSTPSVGRATYTRLRAGRSARYISIHTLRGEGDAVCALKLGGNGISIHTLRGEGDKTKVCYELSEEISIHTLRGEGDGGAVQARSVLSHFNPHPPWGGRQNPLTLLHARSSFQSTPSVGRATAAGLSSLPESAHFNPHPPWGGRP